MNDETIKQFLDDSIVPVPSSNFNHVVMNSVSVASPEKKRFITFDEPLIMVLFFAATILLLLLLNPHAVQTDTMAVLLVVLGVVMIAVLIALFNILTSRMLKSAVRNS